MIIKDFSRIFQVIEKHLVFIFWLIFFYVFNTTHATSVIVYLKSSISCLRKVKLCLFKLSLCSWATHASTIIQDFRMLVDF